MLNKLKKLKVNWYYTTAFLLLLGFVLINFYNSYHQTKVVQNYRETITADEIKEKRSLAETYNDNLRADGILSVEDVYSDVDANVESSVNLYNDSKPIGSVSAPSIDLELPIYEGTSERELQIGAGHMAGTSLPTGEVNTRSVITAHRGLTTKRMFRDIDKLENGDIFFIESFGEKKAYEVYSKDVVLPNETSAIDLIKDEEVVTLLTCEPYMLNTHRLLVNGKRVPYEETMEVQKKKGLSFSLVDIEYIVLIVVVMGFIARLIYKRYKIGRKNRR